MYHLNTHSNAVSSASTIVPAADATLGTAAIAAGLSTQNAGARAIAAVAVLVAAVAAVLVVAAGDAVAVPVAAADAAAVAVAAAVVV